MTAKILWRPLTCFDLAFVAERVSDGFDLLKLLQICPSLTLSLMNLEYGARTAPLFCTSTAAPADRVTHWNI